MDHTQQKENNDVCAKLISSVKVLHVLLAVEIQGAATIKSALMYR